MLSRVWKCIALFLRLIINRKPKELDLQDSLSGTTAAKNDYKEHPEWRSDEWEDFTVSVAKFEPPNETSMDVFSDMQPVIKKAKTVRKYSMLGSSLVISLYQSSLAPTAAFQWNKTDHQTPSPAFFG